MKVLALFLAFVSFSPAHAAEDPVPESLKLVGSGIKDSDSNRNFALACLDSNPQNTDLMNCPAFRYVSFQDQKATWLGRAFKAPEVKSPEQFRQAFTLQLKFLFLVQRYHLAEITGTLGQRGEFKVEDYLLLPLRMVAAFVPGLRRSLAMKHQVPLTSVSVRDGWSWSATPDEISTKRYNTVVRILGVSIDETDCSKAILYNPFGLMPKIYEKKADLIEEGVRFHDGGLYSGEWYHKKVDSSYPIYRAYVDEP
jgi:hypothetical protein